MGAIVTLDLCQGHGHLEIAAAEAMHRHVYTPALRSLRLLSSSEKMAVQVRRQDPLRRQFSLQGLLTRRILLDLALSSTRAAPWSVLARNAARYALQWWGSSLHV